MSEELLLDLSETSTKTAKKATAKKAVAKKAVTKKVAATKVAAKKTAAKKTAAVKESPAPVAEVIVQAAPPPAPIVEEALPPETAVAKKAKPVRKSAVLKKAAEMLAQMQADASVAESAKPVVNEVAPVTTPAPAAPPAPAVVAAPPIVEEAAIVPPPAQAAAPAPVSTPAMAEPAVHAPAAAPQPGYSAPAPAGEGPQERRKSKFERWKERRERFRQEKIARQQGGGGQPNNREGDRQPNQRGDNERQPNREGEGYSNNRDSEGQGQGRGQRHPRHQHHNDAQAGGGDEERARAEIPMGPPEVADGILEMTPKGYGFLRQRDRMYIQHPNDAFISADFIRQYTLREGMQIVGVAQKGQRGLQVTSVSEVNGRAPEAMRDLPLFEELKAINPNKKIQLETVKDRVTTRVIDMFTPVGRGQRGLIVAPPRAGKTTLLQHIAEAVVANHPNMHLMILLVDERPEEVTEFKRILPKAEIYASSNDQDIKSHTRIAAFAVERAKRLVECGEHVFMLMDSITRLARAFNNAKSGGATMSGGMGVGAMEIPRRLFAAARNTRQAGSLTVLATALVETGSRMDDMIFQEFKGTGNMELVLDRKIAEQFYYPAVNIFKSGTRREELLLQPFQLDKIHMLRRGLAGHKPIDAIQRVLQLMERYPSNAQMLVDLPNKS
ncbi:transcription termination factor Rho [Prosthecobacter fusiformis]|uniref:Transcription termination factor Rho n=1 Tax=Prosthecobacter fusiformis TaxID=48464 RepID=A0A4R7RQJ1_9BACT|nr:transcription termination factor Rho [Prosthecobacter fusiformis]TDU66547.1 transcription termination factor Rho [Prosthecobacter fusiformis]